MKLFKLNDFKFSQFLNIWLISITFEVSNLDRFKETNEEHSINIKFILIADDVIKLDKSIDVKL